MDEFWSESLRGLLPSPMKLAVASSAERDQVFFRVVSQPASQLDVMDLQLCTASAGLTAPTIPLQYFLTKLAVAFGIKSFPTGHRQETLPAGRGEGAQRGEKPPTAGLSYCHSASGRHPRNRHRSSPSSILGTYLFQA